MRRGSIVLAALLVAIGAIAGVEHLGLRFGRVIDCLLLFAVFACLAWAARGRLRNVALTLCSLAFGLAVVQAVMPLIAPKRANQSAHFSDEGLVSARPLLGWGPRRPGVFHVVKTAADGRVVFDVHATIDEARRRKTVPSKGEHPIPFFGDSFVFGDGVNDDGTLPQAFADLNQGQIPVLNFGFSGWAPSQNLATLQTEPYKSQLGAPRRMILFTATFQVERTACKGAFHWGSAPRYVLDGDTVKYAGPCIGARPKVVNDVLQMLHGFLAPILPGPGKVNERDVETYIKVIEAFVATARSDYKVGTTVLMEPDGDEYLAGTGYTQARIVDTLRADGIDVLVKAEPPEESRSLYQIAGDGHPTALANRATAKQLDAHLRAVDPHALRASNDL